MHRREINIGDERFIFHLNIVIVVFVLSVSAEDNELLRDTVWLNNDLVNVDWMLRDVKNIPCLAFVPGELNVIYRLIGVSDDDDRSMVSNLIEIVANSDSVPG